MNPLKAIAGAGALVLVGGPMLLGLSGPGPGVLAAAGKAQPPAVCAVKKAPAVGVTVTDSERTAYARIIAQVGAQMGVSRDGQVIAVATAIVESGLRNLSYGDRDSIGLFQQRGNGAWGSAADRMDPAMSARMFYQSLLRIPWESMDPGAAAQAVQRSAFPDRYATKMGEAEVILAGAGDGGPVEPCPAAEAVVLDGVPGTYSLGAVKPYVQAAADTLGPKFGINVIGGLRPGDPQDHGVGLALDFMVAGEAGDKLAAYLQANAAALKVKYLIWKQRIWSVARFDEAWRPMADRGSPTQNHMDHVHASFEAT